MVMAINLQKNKDTIVSAWKDVLDEKTSTDWALFGYEGQTNDLTFVSKGDGGLEELQNELNSGKVQYAFARVQDPKTSLPKCVLINWQGEGAPLVRKGTCANHIRDISNLLKGAHVTINARNEEEVDPDIIIDKVSKSTGSAYSFKERIGDVDRQTEPVGTTYKRTIPRNEINAIERDKFWQKEEEEERKRVAEERRKQEEMRAKAERERHERELETQSLDRESPEKQTKVVDSKRKEAEELIAMRKFDARAVFEKNTSAGQLHSRRSSKDNHYPAGVMPEEKTKVSSPTETIKQAEPIAPVHISENNEVKKNGVTPVKEELVVAQTEEQINSDVYTPDFGGLNLDDDGGLKAVAIYDYQAADINEISFQPGDVITHVDLIDPGWWQGIGPDGEFGLFPANYVELLDQPE